MLLVAFLASSACQPAPRGRVYEKEGRRYGEVSSFNWRSTWWNHFERGESYAEGGYLDDAIADFRAALELRDREALRARTYGVRYLEGYFPHRELGIALFRKGWLHEAEEELARSLAEAPSARARYYLDRTRAALLGGEASGSLPPPRVELRAEDAAAVLAAEHLWVSGTARSAARITSLDVNGRAVPIELARLEVPFRARIPLRDGMNHVTVTARDLLGRTRTERLRVRADRAGPSLGVRALRPLASGELELVVTARDASGPVSLDLGSGAAQLLESGEERSILLPPGTPAERAFVATDAVGNRTTGLLHLDPATAGASSAALGGVLLADAGDGRRFLELARAGDDRFAPAIELDGLASGTVVQARDVYLQGRVADDGEVVRIELGDEALAVVPGAEVFFGVTVPLVPGANRIVVRAHDRAGRSSEHVLEVVREEPPLAARRFRLVLACMPFLEERPGGSPSTGLVGELLAEALLARGRFDLVDRADLEGLLAELELASSQLVREGAALELGRIASAEAILRGRIVRRGESIEAWVRVVDTETSRLLATADVYGDRVRTPADVRRLMGGLAQRLELELPRVEGGVVAAEGRHAYLDKGRAHRMREEARLVVVRRVPLVRDGAGRVVSHRVEELARGRLRSVDAHASEAEVDAVAGASEPPAPGDLFVTR